ncbi:MAG: protein tyrosine/serine phosphatase [Lysobacterales bacterium]|jgi:protein tyrosine/serine phosphatase
MKLWHIILITILATLISAWILTRNNFHVVLPGEVYRSSQLSDGKMKEVVQEHGLQTVISLRRPHRQKSWYTKEIETLNELGVERHEIGLDLTFSPRIDHLLELRDLLQNAPRPLLVYCRAGADRTGLASVMTKLLDGSSTLEQARAQVALEFLAVREDSIGILVFDKYAAWLKSEGFSHASPLFNQWLENEFIDLSGNIHFLVDQIRGQLWERPWGLIGDGFEFEVKRSESSVLELSGWAFDTRNTTLVESVEVYLGDVKFEENWYGIYQPWLINDFGKEEYLDSGWLAHQSLDAFADGCYELKLKFTRLDGTSWTSPPSGRICIK